MLNSPLYISSNHLNYVFSRIHYPIFSSIHHCHRHMFVILYLILNVIFVPQNAIAFFRFTRPGFFLNFYSIVVDLYVFFNNNYPAAMPNKLQHFSIQFNIFWSNIHAFLLFSTQLVCETGAIGIPVAGKVRNLQPTNNSN